MAKKKSTRGSMGGAMSAAARSVGSFATDPAGKPAGFVPKSKSGHKAGGQKSAAHSAKKNNRKPPV